MGVRVVDGLVDFDANDVPRHRFRTGSFAGIEGAIIARTGYTGEDGFEVFLPADRAAAAWPAVLEQGAPHGILPVGLGARDTLRLEVRNCLYGHELDDETSPLAAGLGWIVKLKKPGGFIGADAIAARRQTDPRVLVGLLLQGKRIAREGMTVSHAGQPVGRITSGTVGPSVGRPIALAYVDRAHGAVGTELQIDVRGREARGVVFEGSFLEVE